MTKRKIYDELFKDLVVSDKDVNDASVRYETIARAAKTSAGSWSNHIAKRNGTKRWRFVEKSTS